MESSDSENDEAPTPPIQSTTSQPVVKKSKKKTGKPRFRWTPEMIDTLIDCLNDKKSKFEFKGLDFEADLVKLYSNIRKRMVEIYKDGQFGVVDLEKIAEGLSTKELALEKTRFEWEKRLLKMAMAGSKRKQRK